MIESILPEFVEFMPQELTEGILYISLKFEIAIHLCACGCRLRTVTPFSEGEWKITVADNVVTLSPSIGNFQFDCRSHYWIKENAIEWA